LTRPAIAAFALSRVPRLAVAEAASAKVFPAAHPLAYSGAMRTLILTLILATLSACGDVVIGPVDHSCPANPSRGTLESGCGGGGAR